MKRRLLRSVVFVALGLMLVACGGGPDRDGSGTSKGYTVAGFVTHFAGDTPAEGIRVVLGEQTATTDEEGYWEFTSVKDTQTVKVALDDGVACPLAITVSGTTRRNHFTVHEGDSGPANMAGHGVFGDPYVIENVEQLQAMNEDMDAHYTLCDHIDAGDAETWPDGFIPIGTEGDLDDWGTGFNGELDGRGYEIRNLVIDRSDVAKWQEYSYGVGLFRHIGVRGVVRDLGLVGGEIRGHQAVGALAGVNRGTIEDVYSADVEVSGREDIGGFVGENEGWAEVPGTIRRARHDGVVTGSVSTGGIVGSNTGKVIDAANTGEVRAVRDANGFSSAIGGITGENTDGGVVQWSHNAGPVTGFDEVGGVVGQIDEDGYVLDSYNTHPVTGDNKVGGVVGYNDSESNYVGVVERVFNTADVTGVSEVGGVVGADGGITRYSFNTGVVHGSGDDVGGIVGNKYLGYGVDESIVAHSYNMGDVTGAEHVGGIVGYLDESEVAHTFNVGVVKSDGGTAGGVVGAEDDGDIVQSFFRNDHSDNDGPDNGLGQGKSAAELKQGPTYNDWNDFQKHWVHADGADYPDLRENPR